jgi:hypothetical protein
VIIDGIYGSECIDSSGEVLDVEGADVSDWEKGTLLLDWEHEPGEKGASTIVGKTIYCKKIFKRSECENDRQRKYWDLVECPFIYGVARLFDTAGHKEAQAVAAIIRDCAKNNEPIVCRFSVEGATLEEKDGRLVRTLIKRVAVTLKPCNRTAVSGLLVDEGAPEGFAKEPDAKVKDVLDGIVEKEAAKSEHPNPLYRRLGVSRDVESNPWIRDDLVKSLIKAKIKAHFAKTLSAGIANAAPSTLTGHAALQTEDKRRKLVAMCKAVVRDYSPDKGPFRDFAKAHLPEVSDEFLDHFEKLVGEVKAKLAKNEDDDEDEAAGTGGPPPGGYTFRGQPTPKNPDHARGKISFHVDKSTGTGTLRTEHGTLTAYNPEKDPHHKAAGQHFHDIWHSKQARDVHDYAMRNWIKLNSALREGRLPEAVLAHSAAFSLLSANTAVPVHEMMYAYLLDTMKSKGVDPRDKGFGDLGTLDDWKARDTAGGTPGHSSDYFNPGQQLNVHAGTTLRSDKPDKGRMTGDRTPFQLADNKFWAMARYAGGHDYLRGLVRQYGTDARGANTQMMNDRRTKEAFEARQDRQAKKGVDTGDYQGPEPIFGMRNKLSRFMLTMLGGGNTFVPDTHFTRHFFGLDKSADAQTLLHLKQSVMWNPKNADALGQMDRWYFDNHPSVRYMLQHPEFGSYFRSDPEQAIFPAFWAHWLTIAPHEQALGLGGAKNASNVLATHRPYFDEMNRIMTDPVESRDKIGNKVFNRVPQPSDSREPQNPDMDRHLREWDEIVRGHPLGKAESVPGGPLIHPVHAAYLMRDWVEQLGEMGALHRYYTHLLPLLMPAEHEHPGVNLDSAYVRKCEALTVELGRLTALVKADGRSPSQANAWPAYVTDKPHFGGTDATRPDRGAKAPMAAPKINHAVDCPDCKAGIKPTGKTCWTCAGTGKLGVHSSPPVPPPPVVDSGIHGHPLINNTPAQHQLVHGLDLSQAHNPPEHAKNGVTDPQWHTAADGRNVVVKTDPAGDPEGVALREGVYHNMARDFFGLGHFLPATAVVRHPVTGDWMSVQEAVPDAEHYEQRVSQFGEPVTANTNNQHHAILDQHHANGDLAKLHLMNLIMGNGDRHMGNILFSSAPGGPGLRMIDHSHAFTGYGGNYVDAPHPDKAWDVYEPSYSRLHRQRSMASGQGDPMAQPLTPDVKQWLMGLDPEHMDAELRRYGMRKGIPALAAGTLDQLQRAVLANPQISRYDLHRVPDIRY